MRLTKKTLIVKGLVIAVMALTLLSGSPVPAAPPGGIDVTVINTPAQPVPVTGSVEVTGATTVSGDVNSVQSGTWTVGIDPAHNLVSLAPGQTLYFNEGFNVIGGDGSELNFGPFDLSKISKLRIIARAFNNNGGDIRFRVYVWDNDVLAKRMVLDEFSLNEQTLTQVYEAPPPLVLVNLRKMGGIGANYHLVLIGR